MNVSRFHFNVVTLPLVLVTAITVTLLARAVTADFSFARSRSYESATLLADRCQATLADLILAQDSHAFDQWLDDKPLPFGISRIRAFDASGALVAETPRRETRYTPIMPMVRWMATQGILQETEPQIMRPITATDQTQVGTAIVDIDFYGDYALTLQGWITVGTVCAIVIGSSRLWLSAFAKRRKLHLSTISEFASEMQIADDAKRITQSYPADFTALIDALNNLAGTREAQQAAKRFITNVLESMPDSLIVVNPDSSIRSVNKATLELLGYDEEELDGRQFSIVCSMDGQHLTPERLDEFLGSETRRDTEVVYTSKSGARIPIALSGSAITDGSERRTGYVCIGTDIRPRKLAEIEQKALHDKFIQTSRQAGMAEVATGVLHNVGNVLNSVNVSATLIADQIRDSETGRLLRATALLEENKERLSEFLTADNKGLALPDYLIALSKQIASDQERLFEEVDSLTRNVGHIKSIVSTQQQLSKSSSLVEMLSAEQLITEALEMSGKIADRSSVRLIRRFDRIREIETDRHKVLQVLVNLINNAVDAMADCSTGKATLTIGITMHQEDDRLASISISDTGHGIEQEVLTKIFTLGFTTKSEGHGFGLHSASLTATELGGALRVSSNGSGTGATFTLELPLHQAAQKDAA